MPTSMRTLVLGKSSILAPPEIVAKYGPPPGGGQVGPRHRLPQNVATAADGPPPNAAGRAAAPTTNSATAKAAPAGPPKGLVLYVDTERIVIDLTARDGVQAGSVVSLGATASPSSIPSRARCWASSIRSSPPAR